ncbi:MAG: cytochrome c [Cytophagales bacterium]|nr:cytochrome c [Cytophagales bacterium]
MKNLIISSLLTFLLISCGQNTESTKKKAFEMRSYLAGKHLYKVNCINCHKADGKGQGRLYPPLAQSDYFLDNPDRAICITKHGLKGKIMVNDQDYEITMLGFKELGSQDIADLMTYIGNAWGNNLGTFSKEKVDEVLKDCK